MLTEIILSLAIYARIIDFGDDIQRQELVALGEPIVYFFSRIRVVIIGKISYRQPIVSFLINAFIPGSPQNVVIPGPRKV